MSKETRSLIALTAGCTFAAALVGFGSEVFSFRSVYEESGREALILLSRELVFLTLAVLLVVKGRWRGVLAAIVMVLGATVAEWLLFPAALTLASVSDPAGYAERFASFAYPSYLSWALYDVIGIGIAAAFARGLIMMAHVNPKGPRDE